MDEVDLDFNVQEIKDEEKKLPKWLHLVFRILMFMILAGVGITILVLLSNLTHTIRNLTYVPTEEELDQPQEPLQIFEVSQPFNIQIIEEGIERPIEGDIGIEVRKGDKVRIIGISGANENELRKDYIKINILASAIEGWIPISITIISDIDRISIGDTVEVIETMLIHEGEKEKDKTVQINIKKVRLAYDSDNSELPAIINTKGAKIQQIIRDTIMEQRIKDLENNESIKNIVSKAIILNINKFLTGTEKPTDEPVKKDLVVKKDNKVEIMDVYPDIKPYGNNAYVKVKVLTKSIEGWIPITAAAPEDDEIIIGGKASILEEAIVMKGKKEGGFATHGIINIYYPAGFVVNPIIRKIY